MTPPMAQADVIDSSMVMPWQETPNATNGVGGSQPCRMLVIEPDAAVAARLCAALGPGSCTLNSLRELHRIRLTEIDLVMCAVALQDGSGVDAIAYIRGTRPDLPVIITGDIADAELAAEAIGGGALDYLPLNHSCAAAMRLAIRRALAHHRVRRHHELLQTALRKSVHELTDRNQKLQQSLQQPQDLANTDALTGLSNRRCLHNMLNRTWAEAVRNDRPLACMMIDLDRFKMLNDELGHLQGDALLRVVGRVLQANCRQIDVAARFGGDEFCVLMPDTRPRDAVAVAQRVRREFLAAAQAEVYGQVRPGMSIGISHVDLSRPINAEQLMAHADEAMYASKAAPGPVSTIMVRLSGESVDGGRFADHASER